MSKIIAPSLLSANFKNLGNDIEMINRSEAEWFHLDIMDGVFVPNISFGFSIIKHIKELAQKPLDVHLMIIEPDRYIEQFHLAGADILTIHYEACNHLHRSIQLIKKNKMQAGVVLNPHTNVLLIEDIINELDLVCLMSVNPGFGGQKFIENTYEKIIKLKEIIVKKNSKTLIEIDGGVDLTNIEQLSKCGADIFVAGNTVFSSQNPLQTISLLKSKVN
jgi:ribulose-phosphate 3-epimerase